ncbi:uncharacterized protein LOC122616041 [Drosophila teissieri]|uniref:uncharacterized protein LOC122616041 n=1 Tax=Drosophila teissieri TaxID=7243 RepID=UPI001CBA43BE|nr:uncharacterized protein LOC122616041 [Drosophila teissieri]
MLSSEIYSNTTTSTATAAVGSTATASVATASTTTTTMEATTVKVVKPKKRRKRRKRAGHAITTTTAAVKSATIPIPGSKPSSPRPQTGETPSSAPAATSNGARKTKAPYFQHDNREYLARYESFRLTAHTWNYAAVARKFKPLRPALASGANKTRRPAVSKRTHPECACACQQKDQEPALEPAQRTAEHSIQKELPSSQTKINIDGSVLLELLKYSSSSLLETLLGAGSAMATR